MLHYYFLTPLEQWLQDLYKQIGIRTPQQLNIGELAQRLQIRVYYADLQSMAIEHNGAYSVCLDRRLSPEQQWEDFLHELCHLLRHAGNQTLLPDEFVMLQEVQSGHFQLYAAMPFFMVRSLLQPMNLPYTDKACAEMLAQEFGVTPQLALQRTEQIRRRLEAGWDKESQTINIKSAVCEETTDLGLMERSEYETF